MDPTAFDRQFELYEYDGVLFATVDALGAVREHLRFLVVDDSEFIRLDGTTVEVRYKGRDSGRWFVERLKALAAVLRDANGEVTCTITTDQGDPLFEFYRIVDAALVRQRGCIVRDQPEGVP